MIILESYALAAAPTVSDGTGAAFLATPDPKEVWVAQAWTSTIDVDLGAVRDVDAIFLGFTNASADASWTIAKGTGLGSGLTVIHGPAAMRAADSIGPRHQSFAQLDAVHAARYFRISVTQTGGVPLTAGALAIGKAFRAPYEFGGGRTPIDTGIKEALLGGGFGLGEGVVKAQLRWSFIDLTPAQRRTLWALAKRRGEGRPIVVVEELGEDAGFGEEIHYGLFDKFQAYEREAPGQTRWAMSMTEWL